MILGIICPFTAERGLIVVCGMTFTQLYRRTEIDVLSGQPPQIQSAVCVLEDGKKVRKKVNWLFTTNSTRQIGPTEMKTTVFSSEERLSLEV